MKTVLNKLRRDETGQALILALIMLLLGGLIMAPLLGFMGGGLKAGQAYEQRMAEVYAADAGIEDAIWKIKNGLVPDEGLVYDLTVNDKDVHVIVPPEPGKDPMITFFNHIGVLAGTQGDYNKRRPHQAWLFVYAPLVDDKGMVNEYRITGCYFRSLDPGGGNPRVISTGLWILNYDDYVPGTATVAEWDAELDGTLKIDVNGDGDFTWIDLDDPPDGVMDLDENTIVAQPLINPDYMDFLDEDGDGVSDIVDHLGRAFIWEWKAPAKGPEFGDVICRTQRFALSPSIPLDKFPPNVAWLETKENSIQISWSGELITGIEGIMAEATSATGKSTTVLSYVFAEQTIQGGPVAITILTWEIDLQ